MKSVLKLSLLLLTILLISGCDWFEDDDDDVAASSGSESAQVAAAAPAKSAPAKVEKEPEPEPEAETKTVTDKGTYWGRYNGDRPLWYFWKSMSSYPKTFYLTIKGCATDLKVSNNGKRWESGGYLAKESDVSGRGMAVHGPATCKSKTAYVKYEK